MISALFDCCCFQTTTYLFNMFGWANVPVNLEARLQSDIVHGTASNQVVIKEYLYNDELLRFRVTNVSTSECLSDYSGQLYHNVPNRPLLGFSPICNYSQITRACFERDGFYTFCDLQNYYRTLPYLSEPVTFSGVFPFSVHDEYHPASDGVTILNNLSASGVVPDYLIDPISSVIGNDNPVCLFGWGLSLEFLKFLIPYMPYKDNYPIKYVITLFFNENYEMEFAYAAV